MSMPLLPFSLPGLVVEHVSTADPTLLIDARASTPAASCPDCHISSARVHSRYTRRLRDLPVAEHPVCLRLQVRRFRCPTPTCPRRTFAERLPALAPCHAQRTRRLTETVCVLGGESGGEAGARMATRLRMPLSGDTVLRILRSTPAPAQPTPRVLGIDDFALRKGRVYGRSPRLQQVQAARQAAREDHARRHILISLPLESMGSLRYKYDKNYCYRLFCSV
jgi:hypothetical protein